MKKTTSFVVGFCTVLIAGIAVAQVGSPAADTKSAAAVEQPKPTSTQPATEKVEPYAAEKPTAVNKTNDKPKHSAAKAETKPATETTTKAEQKDTIGPELVIIQPSAGKVVHEKTVLFSGETEPGAKVKAGEYAADVTSDGHWTVKLVLAPGTNTVTFKAYDAAGNVTKASITIVYEAPVAKEIGFTANQKYGENADSFEKFWGTATPGTKVTAKSEYGSASTEVAGNGEWLLKVWFEAPAGVPFPVTVSDSNGHSKTFHFTRIEAKKEFWVEQKYGSCSETPAYDVFYGGGAPGTVIEVFSSYGSGRAVIGDGGGWDMKVIFETAPIGETFEVILETSEGHRKVFAFTRLAAEGSH